MLFDEDMHHEVIASLDGIFENEDEAKRFISFYSGYMILDNFSQQISGNMAEYV
jgi:hypothetical protein